MLLALREGERVYAMPKGKALCPTCHQPVLAKCGQIVSWHWAHQASDCDAWSEGESEWHVKWKMKFPKDWQEVPVGNHRADIRTPRVVVELQRSTIDTATVAAREKHYGNMIWIVDASPFHENFSTRDRGSYVTFRWKWPRKTWWHATRPRYFDFGDNLLLIKKIYPDVPCGGWGYWVAESELMRRLGIKKPLDP